MNAEKSKYLHRRVRRLLTITGLVLVLFITIIIALSTGPVNIPFRDCIQILFHLQGSWPNTYKVIILEVRLPRVLLSALVGASLATSGCALQALFRNPMASPYVVGISSGAAFGASLAIIIAVNLGFMIPLPFMAFIFAMLAIFLVYLIASEKGRVPVESLLLAGIAVMTFFTAMVSLMKYIAGDELRSIVLWLMGGFWASTWDKFVMAFPLILLGIIFIMFFSRDLNLLLMGEEHAMDLGINVEYTKKIILVFSSLITAAAVSVSGIIGFVGLIVPHIVRILIGADHRILLPSSCLVGAIFLIWMDTLARTMIQPTELPVGILTASFGAPFFLYLLKKRKRVTGW